MPCWQNICNSTGWFSSHECWQSWSNGIQGFPFDKGATPTKIIRWQTRKVSGKVSTGETGGFPWAGSVFCCGSLSIQASRSNDFVMQPSQQTPKKSHKILWTKGRPPSQRQKHQGRMFHHFAHHRKFWSWEGVLPWKSTTSKWKLTWVNSHAEIRIENDSVCTQCNLKNVFLLGE